MAKQEEEKGPPQLKDRTINLEVDYKERGGVQRYKTVGDFQSWLAEENGFWGWLERNPAAVAFGRTNINNTFFQYHQDCTSHLSRAQNEWKAPSENLHRLESLPKEEVADSHEQELKGLRDQCSKILDALRTNLGTTIQRLIVDSRNHISRHEPEAQFVSKIAESDPLTAVYTLEFLIKERHNAEEVLRPKGHILASLYLKGIEGPHESSDSAYREAIQTWSRELADYKERYDGLKNDYESLKTNNRQTTKRWADKTVDMENQFKEQLETNSQDLANLRETYEAHMVLEAPVKYWKAKRKQHAITIKRIRRGLIQSALGGTVAIGLAALLLLPTFHPSDEIPWQNLGLFVLISTFILWFVRLFVKLLLSNIHLEADAREREVMIQTFMAMMRHKESREGVKKEDIALVLAPIFKPSTTGVIKDDGGPVTLTDFITRMTGK